MNKMRTMTIEIRLAGLAAIGLLLSGGLGLRAANIEFSVASGSWHDQNNWNPAQVPTIAGSDVAIIRNGRTATISLPAEANETQVGYNGSGSGRLEIGSDLRLVTTLNIAGGPARGDVLQTGGTVSANYLEIWGTGSYTQQAGTVTIAAAIDVARNAAAGSTSTYALVNGTLKPKEVHLCWNGAGVGAFHQSGGTITNCDKLVSGYGGADTRSDWYQSGGAAYATELDIGWTANGSYRMTGGDLRLANLLSVGKYNYMRGDMSVGGSASVVAPTIWIAAGENQPTGVTGIWTQTSGTVTGTAEIILARGNNSRGWLSLTGGRLATPTMRLGAGNDSEATFTQSGGVVEVTTMIVGEAVSNDSHLVTQDGIFNVSGNLYLGNLNDTVATARWTLSGGDVHLGKLWVASQRYARGDFAMTGGTLHSPEETVGYHYDTVGTATQSGGTNTIDGKLLIGYACPTSSYEITGGTLSAGSIEFAQLTESRAELHVAGADQEVQAGSFTQNERGTLRISIDPVKGFHPIAIAGHAHLRGSLVIGRTSLAPFAPGMVVTVMTFNTKYGPFTQVAFEDGVTGRVNYYADRVTVDQLRPLPPRTTLIVR
ncbi:MAG: hypothetical protein PHR35_01755 [Kiritimatiellae bacterium]|nr:hypothetical protein [Kiritimatiellia bacterium]